MRVEQYTQQHPEILQRHKIMRVSRKRPGEYDIDNRRVRITLDVDQDKLIVIDGPLQQPISDYFRKKQSSELFSSEGIKASNLNMLPKDARVTFQDPGVGYSRLDAMKVAKEQARFREKAADLAKAGQAVPQDLIEKYEKSIDMKLGKRWSKENRSRDIELPQNAAEAAPGPTPAPAWWAGAAAAVSAQPGTPSYQPATMVPGLTPAALATQTPKAATLGVQPQEDVGYDKAELMQTMFVKRDAKAKQQITSAASPAKAPNATAMYANVPVARVVNAAQAKVGMPATVMKPQVVKPQMIVPAAALQKETPENDMGSRYGSRPGNIYGQLPVPEPPKKGGA